MGFPGGSDGKESACSAGDLGSIPGSGGSTGEENGNLLQCSCLENSKGLVGYSAWCYQESDTTERLSTHEDCNKKVGILELLFNISRTLILIFFHILKNS